MGRLVPLLSFPPDTRLLLCSWQDIQSQLFPLLLFFRFYSTVHGAHESLGTPPSTCRTRFAGGAYVEHDFSTFNFLPYTANRRNVFAQIHTYRAIWPERHHQSIRTRIPFDCPTDWNVMKHDKRMSACLTLNCIWKTQRIWHICDVHHSNSVSSIRWLNLF